jgi:glycosyltransferase domain-containing protein
MNTKKLSIIIPSYNRPKYLERSLSYWSQSEFQIIVVTNIEIFYPRALIIRSDADFFTRLALGLEQSTTPYSLICPDDDFMGLNFLDKAIACLDNDSSAVSVVGKVGSYEFLPDGNFRIFNVQQMPGHCEDNLEKRLTNGFINYSNNYWAIYRKETLNKILITTTDVQNSNLGEMVFKLGALLEGKIIAMNELFWLREIIPNSWGRTENKVLTYLADDKNDSALNNLDRGIESVFKKEFKYSQSKKMVRDYETFLRNRKLKKNHFVLKKIFSKFLRKKEQIALAPTATEKEDLERILSSIKAFGPI